MTDLQQNIATAMNVLGHDLSPKAAQTLDHLPPLGSADSIEVAMPKRERLFAGVQQILGGWLDYDLSTEDHKSEPTCSEKEQVNVDSRAVGARYVLVDHFVSGRLTSSRL